jgi:ABC-type dipeptide/oligopeptide/nickel transport system permease subunit
MPQLLGASPWHRLHTWGPWALAQAGHLFPTAWIGALWGEATLRLLGLGPPPTRDSLGLLLHEELPRLSTDGTALGWAALLLVLTLAATTSLGAFGSGRDDARRSSPALRSEEAV